MEKKGGESTVHGITEESDGYWGWNEMKWKKKKRLHVK